MNNQLPNTNYQPIAPNSNPTQKPRSGCWPFIMGFFLGTIFPFIMLFLIGTGIALFGPALSKEVTSQLMTTYYQKSLRSEIENSLDLPEAEKKEVMQSIDQMMKDFPNMSPEEIQREIQKILGESNLDTNRNMNQP